MEIQWHVAATSGHRDFEYGCPASGAGSGRALKAVMAKCRRLGALPTYLRLTYLYLTYSCLIYN
jgi:hypothetical protein